MSWLGLTPDHKQPGAQRLYESEGYRQIGDFNANPVASFWGEKPLQEATERAKA
jgi:hypothetical protein